MRPTRDDIVAKLRTTLASEGRLRLAVLFGSWARGKDRPGSDVDVAIWPVDQDISLAEESALQVALERAVECPVDLVRLDRADTMLRWRVARDAILLWAATPVEFVRFRAAAASEHADFAPAQALAARAFRRRLLADEASAT